MRSFRAIDLRWSWNGDILISDTGDLASTSDSSIRSFMQEAQTRVSSDLKDWEIHPHLGASMSDLIGEPNAREVAEEGKTRIQSALVRDNFCDANVINIRYVPVDRHQILYNVKFSLPGLDNDERLQLSMIFNTTEYDVMFL